MEQSLLKAGGRSSAVRELKRNRTIKDFDPQTDTWRDSNVEDERTVVEVAVESEPMMVLWLVIVAAMIASTIVFAVNTTVPFLGGLKLALAEKMPIPSLAVSVLCSVCLLFLTRFLMVWAPPAAGSGIPEVKTMLSGFELNGVLSKKVGVAKALGLTFAMASGLPIGTEGPFVHFAACVTAELHRWRPFNRLNIEHVRFTILMAMVSVGSGATLSTPIAGALLGLELMLPHVVDMYSYKELFIASTVASLFGVLLKMTFTQTGYAPLFSTNVNALEVDTSAHMLRFLVLSLPLGALCGFLGGIFVKFQIGLAEMYKSLRKNRSVLAVDLALVGTVGACVVLLGAFEPHFGMGTAVILGKCFSTDPLPEVMMGIGVFPGLLLLFAAKFVMTAASIRLPIPSGCITPTLVIGAILGRFYGHLTQFTGDLAFVGENSEAYQDFAWFGIIGACAFTASVTRTYSIVVAVFELLAVPTLILPLSLSTLVSIAIADKISPSLFDSMAVFKGLPSRVGQKVSQSLLPVEKLMQSDFNVRPLILHRKCSVKVLKLFVEKLKSCKEVPTMVGIVEWGESDDEHLLLGTVKTRDLENLSAEMDARMKMDAQSPPDDGMDLLRKAADLEMLHNALQVHPAMSLKEAAVMAQTSAHNKKANLYVVCHGKLRGVITYADLHSLSI